MTPAFGIVEKDGRKFIMARGPIGESALRIAGDEPTDAEWLDLLGRHVVAEQRGALA